MINKIVLYTTSFINNQLLQTGGIKRFVELTKFVCQKYPESVLYSCDAEEDIKQYGIFRFVKLDRRVPKLCFLPPEANMLITNFSKIIHLKNSRPCNVVIFDVPTAVGPILCGLRNVVLMIRKDLIGYELVKGGGILIWPKLAYLWLCESICMAKSKIIVCQCKYDKDVLKYRHPLLGKIIERKTVVQINNVNPSWIKSKSFEGSHHYFENESGVFRVCFIGGFGSPRKGQDIFLDAALEVLKSTDKIEFILIGGGKRLEEYEQRYKHDNIMFLGRLDNPLPILKACDLLVVPSYADSCPNTVMEALYNGIPVIGSRAGGIPEILLDDESLFDLRYQSLTERILYFVHNSGSLAALKERQKRRKEELTFDWAEKIVDIIENKNE